jgi:hypothetical protein
MGFKILTFHFRLPPTAEKVNVHSGTVGHLLLRPMQLAFLLLHCKPGQLCVYLIPPYLIVIMFLDQN